MTEAQSGKTVDDITVETSAYKNKLVSYVDLCGISKFYQTDPPTDDVAKKIGGGFLHVLNEIERNNSDLKIIVLSDSALLVSQNNKISENDIVGISFDLFYKLLEISQNYYPANLSRIFITKGTYYYIAYKLNEQLVSYTIGGDVLVRCDSANKTGILPFGVFTDMPTLEIIKNSNFNEWQFINPTNYFHQTKASILSERILPNIIKKHFYGQDDESVKLKGYCNKLIKILSYV